MSNIVKKLLKTNSFIDMASELTVEELEEVITYSADKYYNTDNPVITDALYDILIDFLKLKAPKSKVLKTVGAKVKSKNKVVLDYWLGSMDKIKPPSNQLEIWINKYTPPYNLSDKLDGISALLTYSHDKTIKMYTRGTASEGTDITPLIKYLNLPDYQKINEYCKSNTIKGITNLIAFRGELIIKKKVFESNWSNVFKNGRNCIGGLVNSKTINPDLAQDTDLVLYEVVEPFYPISTQFKIIKDLGFNIVFNKNFNDKLSFDVLSKYLKERRAKSEYNTDGIIVTSCDKQKRNIKGNPEYAFAFKDVLEDQKAITQVIKIEWEKSKDHFIKPTLLLEPVSVGGVQISRVTGNNAKFIVDNKLGPGAQVLIIRSGDVIPKIEQVIKIAKSGEPQLPDDGYEWNETKVDIISTKKNDTSVLIKNIYYFFSKLETKGLGEKNIEKMVEAGLNTIPKILDADKERFLMVDGFGEKTGENLVISIKTAMTNVPLAKLMGASNKLGRGIGEERMKQILAIYPNLLQDYKKWSEIEFVEKIIEINGWDEKTAKLLVKNFDGFIKFFNSISKYVVIEPVKTNKLIKGLFTNKIVVFTGFRDKELEVKIETQGGKIGSAISSKTDYLIVKDQKSIDEPTDKITKAIDLKVQIITKDKLIKMLV
jgi:NAD-dependent DNA ligase